MLALVSQFECVHLGWGSASLTAIPATPAKSQVATRWGKVITLALPGLHSIYVCGISVLSH